MHISITKIIEWDMGHRVPFHDNKCQGLHGHRYRLEVTLSGPVDEREGVSTQGMVWDFGDVKGVLKKEIHDVLDHSFMVYERDPLMASWLRGSTQEQLRPVFVPFVPTAENIARWCFERLSRAFPKPLSLARCRVYETPNCWADCSSPHLPL